MKSQVLGLRMMQALNRESLLLYSLIEGSYCTLQLAAGPRM